MYQIGSMLKYTVLVLGIVLIFILFSLLTTVSDMIYFFIQFFSQWPLIIL